MTSNATIPPYRCIVQLTSSDTKVHKSILGQIQNLLDYLPSQVAVEVVCHGASSIFCQHKNNPHLADIVHLQSQAVEIMVCTKMLETSKIPSQDLISGIRIIPSGIGHLVVRQQEGWSYVKAGF